jgi:hypothetical protein
MSVFTEILSTLIDFQHVDGETGMAKQIVPFIPYNYLLLMCHEIWKEAFMDYFAILFQ